jgi:thymidylate kinase
MDELHQNIRPRFCARTLQRAQSLVPDQEADLTILLDIDPHIALRRIRRRGALDWNETATFLAASREAYLAALPCERNTARLNAGQPVRKVQAEAERVLQSFLSRPGTGKRTGASDHACSSRKRS